MIIRTRFAKDIVAEVVVPARKTSKVIVLCAGMPSYPGRRDDVLEKLAAQGFWVINWRYRGSWESDGWFLDKSPTRDLLDVIVGVEKGFVDLWTNKQYRVAKPQIYLIGASFGGPAVLEASSDKRVHKVVALSPVLDWRLEEKSAEPLSQLGRFVEMAFGNGYRMKKKDWDKLAKGGFYNPMQSLDKIEGARTMIINAADDEIIIMDPLDELVERTGADSVMLRSGGHMGLSKVVEPRVWRRIRKFFE